MSTQTACRFSRSLMGRCAYLRGMVSMWWDLEAILRRSRIKRMLKGGIGFTLQVMLSSPEPLDTRGYSGFLSTCRI
ncbi:hypothetical protein BJX99DRAFT_228645 [Aspergillus californicus]